MLLAFIIYLAAVFDKLPDTLIPAIIVCLILALLLSFVTAIVAGDVKEETTKRGWKCVKRLIITVIVCASVNVLIPTEKTMYLMAGAYVTQSIAENPKVQEVGGKMLTIINQKLDSAITEGTKSVKQAPDVATKAATKAVEKVESVSPAIQDKANKVIDAAMDKAIEKVVGK